MKCKTLNAVVQNSEKEIVEGRVIVANTLMSDEEIDDILMS